MNHRDLKLFVVELGTVSITSYLSFGENTLFVMAKSFDEAGEKALNHANSRKQSVIGSDGDLKLETELQIKSIRPACDEIIWE